MQSVDRSRHNNLALAQRAVRQADDRLTEAQRANHDDLGGHADRAKDYLLKANDEIKRAGRSGRPALSWPACGICHSAACMGMST